MDAARFAAVCNVDGPRPHQLESVHNLISDWKEGINSVMEAPTGVGKSLIATASVYQLLEEKALGKVVLSVHTKLLQHQLFTAFKKSLGESHRVVVLYGRRNYMCLRRFKVLVASRFAREAAPWITKVEEYFKQHKVWPGFAEAISFDTTNGDAWWRCVSCADCKKCGECQHNKALEEAKQAQVLIVNHSLLCISGFMTLKGQCSWEMEDEDHENKSTSGVDFLGLADAPRPLMMWIDEAHELAQVMTRLGSWKVDLNAIKSQINRLSSCFVGEESVPWKKASVEFESTFAEFVSIRNTESGKLQDKCQLTWSPRMKGVVLKLAQAAERCAKTMESSTSAKKRFLARESAGPTAIATDPESREVIATRAFGRAVRNFRSIQRLVPHITSSKEAQTLRDDFVVQFEEGLDTLAAVPTTVGEMLNKTLFSNETWKPRSSTFMSATLATPDGDFSRFISDMGLDPSSVRSRRTPTVFNYERQMRIKVSASSATYSADRSVNAKRTNLIFDEIKRSIGSMGSQQSALLLFTSIDRMNFMGTMLTRHFGSHRVFTGGEDTEKATQVLGRGGSIVLGCKRYWTGLDVGCLGLVFIEKLPYEAGFKPLQQYMDLTGKRQQYQSRYVQDMQMSLRQMMGRLIRNDVNVGEVLVGDSRFVMKAAHSAKLCYPGVVIDQLAEPLQIPKATFTKRNPTYSSCYEKSFATKRKKLNK